MALLRDIDSRTNSLQETVASRTTDLEVILKSLSDPINRMACQLSAIEDELREGDRLKFFDWLSTVQYMSHHRSKAKALLPVSGEWVLRSPKFVEWLGSSTSSILWLHGIPGSGKSMLVARVIDYLQRRNESDSNPAPIAYFYCARNTNERERSDPR